MTLVALIGLASVQPALAENGLVVNQAYSAPFYVLELMTYHMSYIQMGIQEAIKDYSCEAGTLQYKILQPVKEKFFGNDIPGTVSMRFQTTCFDDNLVALNFNVSSFGYDDDFTQIALKFTTKTGTTVTKFCVYGVDAGTMTCTADFEATNPTPSTFSVDAGSNW